jgi:hypothetical protein
MIEKLCDSFMRDLLIAADANEARRNQDYKLDSVLRIDVASKTQSRKFRKFRLRRLMNPFAFRLL